MIHDPAQGAPRWFQQSSGAQEEWASLIALSGSNELSVGGVFTQAGQLGNISFAGGGANSPNAFVARLGALPTATSLARPLALGCYPNPATTQMQLPSLPAGTRVQLLDALGRVARIRGCLQLGSTFEHE